MSFGDKSAHDLAALFRIQKRRRGLMPSDLRKLDDEAASVVELASEAAIMPGLAMEGFRRSESRSDGVFFGAHGVSPRPPPP